MSEGLSGKVASGSIWRTIQSVAVESVRFIMGMLLARLLTPDDFGTVALMGIFIGITSCVASFGFGNSLVQAKKAGDMEFNSVFYVSVAMAIFSYTILFFCAPLIARFYHMPELVWMVRAVGINIVLSSINSVQGAEIARKMRFDLGCYVNVICAVVGSVSGVVFAYLGWGAWALICAALSQGVTNVLASWTIIAWRPKLMFSFAALKPLFRYGWKVSANGILWTIYNELYSTFIGRMYSKADLAFVTRGRHYPNMVQGIISGSLIGVSFPALSRLQDDVPRLREALRRLLRCSSFIVLPTMAGLAICARPILTLLYGDQWGPSVPYVWVTCGTVALYPIGQVNLTAFQAMGRSDIPLKLQIAKRSIALSMIALYLFYFSSHGFGVLSFCVSMAVVMGPLSAVMNVFPSRKLLEYGYRSQLYDLMPATLLSLAMGAVVIGVQYLISPFVGMIPSVNLQRFIIILVSAMTGISFYFGLARALKLKALHEYLSVAIPMFEKKCKPVARLLKKLSW